VPMLALLNPGSGSADHARKFLQSESRFIVQDVEPSAIPNAVRAEVDRGTARILICGGDGTIAAAVGAAAGTRLEIAVFPGGTLNHFARDMGIPVADPVAALKLAATGNARPTDLGYVNGRAFLNTSAVGAYVDFVRFREAIERHFGYRLSSVIAAARVGFRPRLVSLEVRPDEGTTRRYDTPLLFVGVGERFVEGRLLGSRRPGGASALHVVVTRGRARPKIVAHALGAIIHGRGRDPGDDGIDVKLLTNLLATMKASAITIALDGELVRMNAPLRYAIEQGAVLIVREAPARSATP
jgi:diacylglycerol kinase family enzyme